MGPEVVILGILGAVVKAVLPALARGAGAIIVGEQIGKVIDKVDEALTVDARPASPAAPATPCEEDDQEEA